jgi:uncharacterized protein YndB with AHSA1/START domain
MSTYTERPPEWIPSAPLVNERSRVIAASRAVVWQRIADHTTWPEWFTSLKRVVVNGAAEGVGGRRAVSIPGATVNEVFTAWEPEQRFAFTLVDGPPGIVAIAESVELVDHDGGTLVTYRQGFEPRRGWGRPVRLVVARMDRELAKALEQLDALVAPT